MLKRKDYEAGYTLKLLVPFVSATGLGNVVEKLTPIFVPGAKKAGLILKRDCEVVIISTAYKKFVEKSAQEIGFERVHASEVEFKMELDSDVRKMLLDSVDVIASLSGGELYDFLDKLFSKFWESLKDLKVIGAREKAEILESYAPDFPIAIGDSITDCKMFEKAKELGGVAIAFNGNKYALEKADLAIISNSAMAEALVVRELLKSGNYRALKSFRCRNAQIFLLEEADFEKVLRASMKMRVKLRSAAGKLG